MNDDLARMVRILWPTDAPGLQVTEGGRAPRTPSLLESYLVVPNARRAAFVLPASGRRAAVAALHSYNRLRPPRTRLARAGLATVIRAGGARALPDRLMVTATEEYDHSASPLLRAHLGSMLDEPRIELAAGVRHDDPNSKPTAQVYRRDGTPIAFAKVGWNPTTVGQVRVESAALARVCQQLTSSLSVPKLLAAGPWQDRELCVVAPLPRAVRRWADPDRPPDAAVTESIAATAAVHTVALGGSSYLRTLEARAKNPGWDPEVRAAFTRCLGRVGAGYGETPVRFGAWHGDWVPWNVATEGGRLWVWDWEHYAADVPIGLDLVNWHFLRAFVGGGATVTAAFALARERALDDLKSLQGNEDAARACSVLYLLEITARYETMYAAGSGRPKRFHPDVLSALSSSQGDS